MSLEFFYSVSHPSSHQCALPYRSVHIRGEQCVDREIPVPVNESGGAASITGLLSSMVRERPVKRISAPLGINFSGHSMRLKIVLVEGRLPIVTAARCVTVV